MPAIGLFYASSTGNSETVARRLVDRFNPIRVDAIDIMHFNKTRVPRYKNYIFGIPTWDRSNMHEDWRDFLPTLSRSRLSGKRIALFGLGDQMTYPNNFVDSMGMLYEWLYDRDAWVVGYWPVDGYRFNYSLGVRGNHFVGLALDEDNQAHLTKERVDKWVDRLTNQFGL